MTNLNLSCNFKTLWTMMDLFLVLQPRFTLKVLVNSFYLLPIHLHVIYKHIGVDIFRDPIVLRIGRLLYDILNLCHQFVKFGFLDNSTMLNTETKPLEDLVLVCKQRIVKGLKLGEGLVTATTQWAV